MVLPIIEAERIKHPMGQNELAQALGVSKRTLSNWQSGVAELPLSKLMILSKPWSRSLDYLLGLDEYPARRPPVLL